MLNPTDKFSAVFGNSDEPLVINSPNGIFNSSFNASWSAAGINPAFLSFFPEMADDTYATVGLDGPAAGIEGAADPSLVEDVNQAISPYFLTDGATLLESTTSIGALRGEPSSSPSNNRPSKSAVIELSNARTVLPVSICFLFDLVSHFFGLVPLERSLAKALEKFSVFVSK